MAYDFDYYGNQIVYEVEGDVDGVVIHIAATSKPIEDKAEQTDIEFHCHMDYLEMAEKHFLKTGTYLD